MRVLALVLAMVLLTGCASLSQIATPEEASQKNWLDWRIESKPPEAATTTP